MKKNKVSYVYITAGDTKLVAANSSAKCAFCGLEFVVQDTSKQLSVSEKLESLTHLLAMHSCFKD